MENWDMALLQGKTIVRAEPIDEKYGEGFTLTFRDGSKFRIVARDTFQYDFAGNGKLPPLERLP
jgi:hypothetical protein